jgi:hypothetical protein
MEGFGSGVGVEGAAAGACAGADAPPAGACCCPKAGRLNTAISTNVRRPPHCFFKVTLLSSLYFCYSYEASSLRRDFTRRLKERPTQFFDRTYLKLFAYCLWIPNLLEKSIGPMQKTGGFFAYDVSSRII